MKAARLKTSLWGSVRSAPGAAWSAALANGHLVVIFGHGGEQPTAIGLRLDSDRSRAEPVWSRELDGPYEALVCGVWRVVLSPPSVVATAEGRVCLVSGRDRLLVDGASGDVLVQAQADAPASAPAVLSGPELLVAEGQVGESLALAAYDAASLALRWRREGPPGYWCQAPPDQRLCPVNVITMTEPRRSPACGLWILPEDTVWTIPEASSINAAPLRLGSMVVLSCEAGERLVSLHVGDGTAEVVWSAEVAPPTDLFGPQSQGAFLGPYPLVAWGDYVVALTQLPTVEARVAETGELVWRVPLTDAESGETPDSMTQPMVMELIDGLLWVGVRNGRVLAIDPARGAIEGQAYVSGSSHSPSPVAIERLHTNGSTRTMIVTGDGTLHGIAPSPVSGPTAGV